MTAERYTAVFTRLLSLKKPGEYPYARMDDDPLGSGGYSVSRGRPPYGELGRELSSPAPTKPKSPPRSTSRPRSQRR